MSTDAILKAREAVRLLSPKSPADIDLNALAKKLDVMVLEEELPGCDGMLIRKRKGAGIVSIRISIKEEGRKRFTLGHELGHFMLGHAGCSCGPVALTTWSDTGNETDANRFAAELLLPTELVEPMVKAMGFSYQAVRSIATGFRCSLTATAIRFVEFSRDRCAVVLSRKGQIQWFTRSKEFGYRVQRGDDVAKESFAFDATQKGGCIPDVMTEVDETAWFSDSLRSDETLLEQSVGMRSYDEVLTLLRLDERRKDGEEADEVEDENVLPSERLRRMDRRRWDESG